MTLLINHQAVREHALPVVQSLSELLALARSDIDAHHPAGCELICGPISAGGFDNYDDNVRVFYALTRHFQDQGCSVLDLMPYVPVVERLKRAWWHADPLRRDGQEYVPLFTDFYDPLLRSGGITRGRFVPTWPESPGAVRLHELMADAGIPTTVVTSDVMRTAMAIYATTGATK